MIAIKADLDLCQGYANCVAEADDVFDLDDDTELVTVVRRTLDDSESARVKRAVSSCPVKALSMTQEPA